MKGQRACYIFRCYRESVPFGDKSQGKGAEVDVSLVSFRKSQEARVAGEEG